MLEVLTAAFEGQLWMPGGLGPESAGYIRSMGRNDLAAAPKLARPRSAPELPVELRREVFLGLSDQIRAGLSVAGVSVDDVLQDFRQVRQRRRRVAS